MSKNIVYDCEKICITQTETDSLGSLRFEKIKQKKVDSAKKPVYVLSCGAGVNTVALLVLIHKGELPCDEVIFADTGYELPETYKYIKEVITPFCDSKGLTFTTVTAPIPLYEYYWSRNIIPTRKHRDCTDKFKIQPIHRYLTYKYPKQKYQVYTYMGIAADESRRVNKKTLATTIYPLVDRNIDRAGCIRLIKDYKLPIPVKSGCYFCPFQPETAWYNLWKNHNQLFSFSISLEVACQRFPNMYLAYPHIGPLAELGRKFAKGYSPQTSSNDKDQVTLEQSCEWCEVGGSCFNTQEDYL